MTVNGHNSRHLPAGHFLFWSSWRSLRPSSPATAFFVPAPGHSLPNPLSCRLYPGMSNEDTHRILRTLPQTQGGLLLDIPLLTGTLKESTRLNRLSSTSISLNRCRSRCGERTPQKFRPGCLDHQNQGRRSPRNNTSSISLQSREHGPGGAIPFHSSPRISKSRRWRCSWTLDTVRFQRQDPDLLECSAGLIYLPSKTRLVRTMVCLRLPFLYSPSLGTRPRRWWQGLNARSGRGCGKPWKQTKRLAAV
ncbi:hypothetical protein QBC39DRAFT_142116 [Podospora conica]|nr:hypothetical protein QBC39DRAFT_142116 [Schizothecium conicum]